MDGQMIVPVPERPVEPAAAYSLAPDPIKYSFSSPGTAAAETAASFAPTTTTTTTTRSWTDDIGPVQLFLLFAVAMLLLVSLGRVLDFDYILASIGFLPATTAAAVVASPEEKTRGTGEEGEEDVRYRSGSSRDAVPVDAAAKSSMTGTSLEPSFVDPSRAGYYFGSRADDQGGEVVRPPRSSGAWSKSSSTWWSSSSDSPLLGPPGRSVDAASIGTSGLTGILDRGVAAPLAPRLEYTKFQPVGQLPQPQQ